MAPLIPYDNFGQYQLKVHVYFICHGKQLRGGGTQINHVVIREQNMNARKGTFLHIVTVQADRI